jgi:phosphatidylglycerophosphate synthase
MTDVRLSATGPGPLRSAVLAVALTAATTAAALAALPFAGTRAPLAGLLVVVALGAVVLDRLAAFHPHDRLGLGNVVTLGRAGGAAVFVALALEPGLLAGGTAWAAFGLALALLALDGLDGWLARRQGLVSAFGARLDMEVDALLGLALSTLAFGLGKAGAWVLAIGLMRYAFVAAGCLAPRLARPLPPSARRRGVCALQIGALALLLAPPVLPPVSTILAAGVLAALAASFATDVIRLLRAP